jgi:S-adenosylmethionine hydrolase
MTVHLLEPSAPQHGRTIFSRCGEAIDKTDAQRQQGQRIDCRECLRLDREDEESIKALETEGRDVR